MDRMVPRVEKFCFNVHQSVGTKKKNGVGVKIIAVCCIYVPVLLVLCNKVLYRVARFRGFQGHCCVGNTKDFVSVRWWNQMSLPKEDNKKFKMWNNIKQKQQQSSKVAQYIAQYHMIVC